LSFAWPKALTAIVALVALLVGPTRARAAPDQPAPAPAPPADRPWAAGVTQERQDDAWRLFKEGNELFAVSKYAEALVRYRDALKAWEHPAIRYNAAVALINLDQPLAAFENLELALRYAAAPLGEETYQQAQTYRKLLLGQLAELEVDCAESGAEVTLDGQALFVAPGAANRRLLPGRHQLVARKAGFLAETRSLNLLPGRPSHERLTLQDIRYLPTKTVRRWSAWKPWAVVGGGALLIVLGVPVIADAVSNIHTYEAEVATSCAGMGCPPGVLSPSARDARDRSRLENIVAVSLFSVGAAVAAGGVAMVIRNQPRVIPADEQPRAWLAAPMLGPGVVGLQVAFRR
jgi:hypothetical protein